MRLGTKCRNMKKSTIFDTFRRTLKIKKINPQVLKDKKK